MNGWGWRVGVIEQHIHLLLHEPLFNPQKCDVASINLLLLSSSYHSNDITRLHASFFFHYQEYYQTLFPLLNHYLTEFYIKHFHLPNSSSSATKLNSVALVRKRIILTERPPPVGEVLVPTFTGRGCCVVSATNSHGR
jgi:hypothetical protein